MITCSSGEYSYYLGVLDCEDNDGQPYSSQWAGDLVKDATALLCENTEE